jgi:hypothetical protein
MNVFLVPIGRGRHELYCEVSREAEADVSVGADAPRSGWVRRQVARFREMLAEAEAEREQQERGEVSQRRGVGRWVMAKLAETIAEQRLLWRLRSAGSAVLRHPADQDGQEAMRLARRHFSSDCGKHRRWLVIDALITAVTGPLFFFVPGPNIISWYFAFRAVGHYYAMNGASRALSGVAWATEASDDLTALRVALDLDPGSRRERLEEIGQALGLPALSGFIERVARRTS